ncbi:MAG: hypothetical protein Tsb0034_25700 [Ekhidna sp.]
MAEEYAEGLADIAEAEKAKSLFTPLAISKMHFYKGMLLFKMGDFESAVDETTANEIMLNFSKALELDSSWSSATKEVLHELHLAAMKQAASALKQARKVDEDSEVETLLNAYIAQLSLAERLEYHPDIELKKAEAYHELGDLYFKGEKTLGNMRKAADYFQKAIHEYELARYNDPFSKDIIKDLLLLSQRMDDVERIQEYSQLLELAGG